MRKSKSANSEKPKSMVFSLKKVIVISILFVILMGMAGTMASNARLNNVKIELSSGYIMNVMTSSTKVRDILKESHVLLLDDEMVSPSIDAEITDNRTIKISKDTAKPAQEATYFSAEEILESYKEIVEKVVTVQETIPYETETRDVSNGQNKQNRIVQQGKNGLKEITYKIKYKNGEEIQKDLISEKVISEPVNKIVEVRTRVITSRSGPRTSDNLNSSELETIWAIVRQEGGSSYESALAVCSSAVNRTRSPRWKRNGSTIYQQLTARGQYCYSIDNHWRKYLGGNVPDYVKRAVADAMNGKTNHPYTSFRSQWAATKAMKASGVTIGGNSYFGN